VTKKVRLTQAEANLLSELAQAHDASQSEILRRGLRAVDRVRRRQANIHQLVALAEGDPADKIRFELED
jgi:predicted transcriptional regulator